MKNFNNVDEYIESAPKEIQGTLNDIRKAILAIAPEATEKMSYGMPYYGYKGRLIYFAWWKDHIAIYAMPDIVLDKFKKELAGHIKGKGTIWYNLDEDIPMDLIKRMVKAQVEVNESKKK